MHPNTIAKTKKLLCSAALSAGAALGAAGQAHAETPAPARATDMRERDGVLVCKIGNSKGPKYAACTTEQIAKNAAAEARALLAATPDVAKIPAEVRYAPCRIGNTKGPAYDGGCYDAMEAVFATARKP